MATNNNREYFFINSEIDRIVRFSKWIMTKWYCIF
jgi:hypothetical protein